MMAAVDDCWTGDRDLGPKSEDVDAVTCDSVSAVA